MKSVRTCPVIRRKFPEKLSKACVFGEDGYSAVYYCIYCDRKARDEE